MNAARKKILDQNQVLGYFWTIFTPWIEKPQGQEILPTIKYMAMKTIKWNLDFEV